MLLAIDTASSLMSIAVYGDGRILAEHTQLSHNQHTVQLSECIQRTLAELGLSIGDLNAIGIAQGAGSYSGLRVGFGVAKGIATARQIPLIPIPTLEIIAASTPHFDGTLIATVQAGRRRIVACPFTWQGGAWQLDGEPINTTWAELLADLPLPVLVNGEIDALGEQALQDHPAKRLSPAWNPRRAGFLALLAWQRWMTGDYPTDLSQANPLYLKEP